MVTWELTMVNSEGMEMVEESYITLAETKKVGNLFLAKHPEWDAAIINSDYSVILAREPGEEKWRKL